MDSLTHFALGAGVGMAVMGRRLGPRKAAIVGGVLANLPDLDVFVPFDDIIDNFILHRSATHSLIVQAVVTPVFGEALVRWMKDLRGQRVTAYLAVYLCLATHALLDAMTIYGTRVLWPLWTEPIGLGSVFIIDPAYTLPLLVALIWGLCLPAWTPRLKTVLTTCFALSTAYLGWGAVAQQLVQSRATEILHGAGTGAERLIAIPTPFNSLYWRVIAVSGDSYVNLYIPVFGPAAKVTSYLHRRRTHHARCLAGVEAFSKLVAFSDGFYRIDLRRGEVIVSDLRMGLTPNYAFRYAVAVQTADGVRPIPPRRLAAIRRAPGDIAWLVANLSGGSAVRPAEASASIQVAALSNMAGRANNRPSC